ALAHVARDRHLFFRRCGGSDLFSTGWFFFR
ncbi:uncharacterized protein METZ01_LOCUS443776, partial [marine metagenome]